MKKPEKVIFVLICILFAAFLFIGSWAVDAGLARDGYGSKVRENTQKKVNAEALDPDTSMYKVRQFRKSIAKETEQFEKDVPEEEITIESEDGLKLAGYLRRNEGSHVYVLCFHGYRASHQEITDLGFARRFYEMGYNVLCPDQRAQGNSEGRWIGMGWLERKDVVSWADYIFQMDPEAEIILFGESMGAAAVLASTGENLPACVKAVIADSAYAGTFRIASEALWNQAHIPSFPLLEISDVFCYFKAGYMLMPDDILDEAERCRIPVLLFHGADDQIVSSRNMEMLYDALPGSQKEAVLFPDAGHVCSSQVDPDAYWASVVSFLDTYTDKTMHPK